VYANLKGDDLAGLEAGMLSEDAEVCACITKLFFQVFYFEF